MWWLHRYPAVLGTPDDSTGSRTQGMATFLCPQPHVLVALGCWLQ